MGLLDALIRCRVHYRSPFSLEACVKLILKVHHSDHGPDSQSEYASLHLTVEYARLLLERRTAFESAKHADGSLYRLTYWDAIDWFGGSPGLRDPMPYPESWHVEDYGEPTEGFLRQYLTEEQLKNLNHGCGPQLVAADFEVPEGLLDNTDCNLVDVLEDGILFKSYPNGDDGQQETDCIPWTLILQATNTTGPDPSPPAGPSPLFGADPAAGSPASAALSGRP